jgi:AraC-like DNA-binding protein
MVKGQYTAYDFISTDLIITNIENVYWNEITNWTRPNPEPRYANGLVLVTSGRIDYVFGNECITGQKGDVLLLPKNIPYSGMKFGDDPNSYYVLDFSTQNDEDCVLFPLPLSFPANDYQMIEDRFRSILRQWSSKSTASRLKCRSEIYNLLTILLYDYSNGGSDWNGLDLIFKITNYIGIHFTDPQLNVKKICEYFYISESQLRRIFRESLAQPPLAYIQSLRLEMARSILSSESGNALIEETACSCGFSSLSYFSRLFKERFAVPPSKYVKRVHKI